MTDIQNLEVNKHRYHSLSIALHWIIVLGLLFMFVSGVYMVNADIPKSDQYKLFQVHKASGVIMLWAIALRIAVRIFTPSPEPVAQLNHQQRKHAKLGHFGLYAALVTMPLSGWLMVSASPFGLPTLVFVEWINWPHIPGVARNKAIESIANTVHWVTASTLLVLVIGHVSAVVWHKKAHKINLVKRMWWSKNV
jgi:cytochrome b561